MMDPTGTQGSVLRGLPVVHLHLPLPRSHLLPTAPPPPRPPMTMCERERSRDSFEGPRLRELGRPHQVSAGKAQRNERVRGGGWRSAQPERGCDS